MNPDCPSAPLAGPSLAARPLAASWLAVSVLATACGEPSPATPDAAVHLDPGPDDFHVDRVGVIDLIEGGGFLSVYASITDGPELPVPVAIAAAGDCAVYRRPPPALCQAPCDGVCVGPDQCAPWPRQVNAGVITVTGLTQPLRFVPGSFGYEPDPAPPLDLFTPGAAILVSAPGGAVGGFDLALTGVADLTGTTSALTLVDGRDTEVTWTAAASGRIQLAVVVGWHGAPYEALLLCETDDDGALTVPGELITALPRASSSLEAHVSTLTRFERHTVTAPAGTIEVLVGSQVPIYPTR